ncbi:hypothetical protein [Dietzia sp.]|uniref:hypothetical protein n=1 Tax=Dietzia sp. TaxID=1871616 RepID=UPI002FD90A2E
MSGGTEGPARDGSVYGIDGLAHDELAALVREQLLIGQLIDRAGMPALLAEFGLEGMRDVAIEEWQAASPHYALRMKRALGISGDGVAEIFKGFQLDIGAPPEFMDFRYTVHDHDHGEFHLDHCGALMDVEPMGDQLVKVMCHDIEDPTFPATAFATNPRAVVEPVHRPPRSPAGRTPHCQWTVRIDADAPPAELPAPAAESASAAAVSLEFPEPAAGEDPREGLLADYSGPLLSDLHFPDFDRAALVRIAREVALQMHLLALGFAQAVRRRSDTDTAVRLLRYQCTGISGVATGRIAAALGVTAADGPAGLARIFSLHPIAAPAEYTGFSMALRDDGEGLDLHWAAEAPWWRDEGWAQVLGSGDAGPLEAAARAIDPRYRVDLDVSASGVKAAVLLDPEADPDGAEFAEREEVAVTRLSSGAGFEFGPVRRPIPLTPL